MTMHALNKWVMATTAVLGLGAAAPAAAAWPDGKPVTMVVPYTAGGSADAIGRRLADALKATGNITVVVENKAGAGASLGTDQVARSQPDGLTLLLTATSPVTIFPHVGSTRYDPIKDLTPIASVAVGPVVIAATKALPVKDFPALVEHAKAKPDSVRFGSPGLGSVAHLGMAAITDKTGTRMTHVPYRGSSQAMTDGLGGQVELLVLNTDVVLPQVASGNLHPLAVMAPQRLADWPDTPTMDELGIPEAQRYSNFAVFAPGNLPADVRKAVTEAVVKAADSDGFKAFRDGVRLQPGSGSGEAFAQQIRAEHEANGRIVKAAGIKIE